ncbi:unnamed protein product [Ilex paraguariensis]|uniref:Uncharacterized protein n=1 Tax=Ilex paraguariensis TaxID=185542 RepID=A0ABC8RZ06_9AQUA
MVSNNGALQSLWRCRRMYQQRVRVNGMACIAYPIHEMNNSNTDNNNTERKQDQNDQDDNNDDEDESMASDASFWSELSKTFM